MDDALKTATGALDTLFGVVSKGQQVYNQFDAARDQRAVVPAQTSVAPTKTTVTPAGVPTVSPNTLYLTVGALVLIGVVVMASRK